MVLIAQHSGLDWAGSCHCWGSKIKASDTRFFTVIHHQQLGYSLATETQTILYIKYRHDSSTLLSVVFFIPCDSCTEKNFIWYLFSAAVQFCKGRYTNTSLWLWLWLWSAISLACCWLKTQSCGFPWIKWYTKCNNSMQQ